MTLSFIERGGNLSKVNTQPFVTLSEETRQAALAKFGKCNIYIQIGNATQELFANIDLLNIYPETRVPKDYPYVLGLVLIFQCNEGLGDLQAAEATRVRTDWKYALHLPLNFPGLNPDVLCDFRQRLCLNDLHKANFKRLLDRVQEYFCLKGQPPADDVDFVLQSVCSRSRLELAATTMQVAIQALTVTRYEWLSRIMRPHWYQRYSRSLATLLIPDDLPSQVNLTESIGIDGFYLSEMVSQANDSEISKLHEIQILKRVWETQFEQPAKDSCRHTGDCSNCGVKLIN
ncbi:MAG: hypothetical protein HZB51_26260 [Chloroflexi bacterium]|nr:hypothetical protein [Chloroflexota bacterium]